MEEPERRRLFESVLPLLAIVLITSGIVVRTVPLESKRPADPEHAKFSYAGRQDVKARLWEDPFGAMRHIKGRTPGERCEEALQDEAHRPYTLSNRIKRLEHTDITVLPVLIQGGPHFEDGESRRRARYAVVTAVLNAGWVPSDEDKMGYVWTFENCLKAPGRAESQRFCPTNGSTRVRGSRRRSRMPRCLASPNGCSSSGSMRMQCRAAPWKESRDSPS